MVIAGVEGADLWFSTRSNVEVARPQIFDGSTEKVFGFLMACKLFMRMKMRKVVVEKQIQWILSYVQEESVDIWKENILEDLEVGSLEYETVEEFWTDLKKEFGGGDNKTIKVTELKRIEQESRMIEEFV